MVVSKSPSFRLSIAGSALLFVVAAATSTQHEPVLWAFSDEDRQESKVLNVEAKTFRKGFQQVVLVDLVPVGPRDYYDRVALAISDVQAARDNTRVLVEGIKCTGNAYQVKNGENFSPFFFASHDPSHTLAATVFKDFTSIATADVLQWEKDEFLVQIPCANSSLGKDLNFSFVARQAGEDYAAASDLGAFLYNEIKHVQNADLDLSSLSSGHAAAFWAVKSCEQAECNHKFGKWLYTAEGMSFQDKVHREISFALRQKILLSEIQKNLSESNNVVVTWSPDHSPGLTAALLAEGFEIQKAKKIRYADCALGSSLEGPLGQLIKDKCDKQ